MNLLVSVVIPTANRPQWLLRAVESALAGMDKKDIEVVVVPNGADQSWRESLAPYKDHPSVRVIPITEANANIARNTGMENARGEFIRFLDDDDYLIPEGATKQYELIQASGADVVSGNIKLLNKDEKIFDQRCQPDINDFCSAILGAYRVCLPQAHVYKHSKIKKFLWNPKTQIRQDVEWVMELCTKVELSWYKINDYVGVWVHHTMPRISTSKEHHIINRHTVPMLKNAYESLAERDGLDECRRRAVAQGLWRSIHAAFYIEPSYWCQVARYAATIDSHARPIQPIYSYPFFKRLDPLLLQWLFFPKRWLYHQYRKFVKSN